MSDWFCDWDPAWIVYEDEGLVVVDKPAGVPSQSADPARPDDVPTRLRRHLAARDGGTPYLGVHQRLDQATSGLLLYTKDRALNAPVAAAFEGRKVKKSYLALVTGWRGGARTLTDRLATVSHATASSARRQVARSANPRTATRGELAITHVKPVAPDGARRSERTLLELTLETGRTHQARVQLQGAGAPIVGDAWYGGVAAPRLCLHSARLQIPLERNGRTKQLSFEAKPPEVFRSWLAGTVDPAAVYDDETQLRAALRAAAAKRWWLGRSDLHDASVRTTTYRLVHAEGDGLPELAVDVYGEHVVAQFYGTDGVFAEPARRQRVLDLLAEQYRGVYQVVRPKQANELVSTRRDELSPKTPVRGEAAPDPLIVHELGMPVQVRLGDGLATGIYLDQRDNRAWVRAAAQGKSVLNLFAYTSLFSVAAACGGATRTVSVDASGVALERARENFELAGVDLSPHVLVAEDVFGWLVRMQKKGVQFDLVVCDPPAYSSTKKRRFSVADGGWIELAQLALSVLAPGGQLLAFTNHRKTPRTRFRKHLSEGAARAGVKLVGIKDRPDAADFPPPFGEDAYLKGAIVSRV